MQLISGSLYDETEQLPRLTSPRDITNHVDHISDGGTSGLMNLCELTRDFRPARSSSRVAEYSRSGEEFQVCLDRGCPRLQLVSDQQTLKTSHTVVNPRGRRCRIFTVGMQSLCFTCFHYQRPTATFCSCHLCIHACNRSLFARGLSIDSRAYVISQHAR